ncbi:MAG: spore coat associated protein CotJA [Clostridia bacterium]|nr:spore coat associated protein CotJA [Clostridia bacterium]
MGYHKPHFAESYSGKITALPECPQVATAYVPFQTDFTTYDEMQALRCGTLFPILNKPFLGSGNR